MRHGQTDWNRERRIMGHTDIGLNDTGREQCRRAASTLTGAGLTRILSSPLSRARESADIVASAVGVPIEHLEGLSEVMFGEWTGRTQEEIAEDPHAATRAADPADCPAPGGETMREVQRRGLESLEAVRSGETVLVVSHADILRSLLSHFLGMELAEYRRIQIDNGALAGVTITKRRSRVHYLNVAIGPGGGFDAAPWQRGH